MSIFDGLGNMNIFIRTAIITLVVFFAGIGLGLVMSGERINSLESSVTDLTVDLNDVELQFLFMDVMHGNISCAYLSNEAERLGATSEAMGRDVERYEYSDKLRTSDFIALKQKYTSAIIRNWLTMEKIKSACENDYVTVLYFYDGQNCDRCTEQGVILSYLKDKLKGDIMIFAIDNNIGLRIVDGLKEAYSVTSYPTLIVNGEKYVGFYELKNITAVLCSYNSGLEVC